jgi:peptidoglycan hydrolase-like protein with peptidoglycan-binding domain
MANLSPVNGRSSSIYTEIPETVVRPAEVAPAPQPTPPNAADACPQTQPKPKPSASTRADARRRASAEERTAQSRVLESAGQTNIKNNWYPDVARGKTVPVGFSGADVGRAQSLLNELDKAKVSEPRATVPQASPSHASSRAPASNEPLKVDSCNGPKTSERIKSFQKEHKLPGNGNLTPETLERIEALAKERRAEAAKTQAAAPAAAPGAAERTGSLMDKARKDIETAASAEVAAQGRLDAAERRFAEAANGGKQGSPEQRQASRDREQAKQELRAAQGATDAAFRLQNIADKPDAEAAYQRVVEAEAAVAAAPKRNVQGGGQVTKDGEAVAALEAAKKDFAQVQRWLGRHDSVEAYRDSAQSRLDRANSLVASTPVDVDLLKAMRAKDEQNAAQVEVDAVMAYLSRAKSAQEGPPAPAPAPVREPGEPAPLRFPVLLDAPLPGATLVRPA